MWSSHCRRKAAAVSRADQPQVPGEQDVGSSIAAAFTRPHHSSSTLSGTLGDATTLWPAAYPPIAAASGGCRRRQLDQQQTSRPLPGAPTIGVVLSENCHRHVPKVLVSRHHPQHDRHGYARPLERVPVMLSHFSGVMAGLVPAIHALLADTRQEKRGCPRQARA